MWNFIAKLIASPMLATWLITRSLKTPYLHLPSNEDPSYMGRYWLFNPYDRVTNEPKWRFFPWSIRIHHIKRADSERHMHDHPWNARTIILRGSYVEHRAAEGAERLQILEQCLSGVVPKDPIDQIEAYYVIDRRPGDTATIGFEQYHRIVEVSEGGAWTLFISDPWQGVWGFMVDGVKVKWREYLGLDK